MKKNTVSVKIGKKIRELRMKKGFSQEDFSYEADIDRAYMGRIERGEGNISVSILLKICFALKVEPGKILKLSEFKDPRK